MCIENTPIHLGSCSWQRRDVVWQQPPNAYDVSEGSVHIWRFFLDESYALAQGGASDLLTSEEYQRWHGMASARRKLEYLTGRVMLRRLMALYQNIPAQGQPHQSIHIRDHKTDAPEPPPPLCASLSHSGAVLLIALARQPVGIDVEKPRTAAHYPHIARKMFPPTWAQALMRLSHAPQRQAILFARYWTAVESLYRLEGHGLLRSFVKETATDRFQENKNWGCHFHAGNSHIAALTASHPCALSCYQANAAFLAALT